MFVCLCVYVCVCVCVYIYIYISTTETSLLLQIILLRMFLSKCPILKRRCPRRRWRRGIFLLASKETN